MNFCVINRYHKLSTHTKASLWFLICAFLQKGISCITTPIFTRLLSTSEFGQFNVFSSWLNIISIVVSLNIWGGIYMQGMVKYEDSRLEYSSSLQGLTLLLVLFWGMIYFAFRDEWNMLFSLTTTQMVAILILVWTSSSFNFWASEQRLRLEYKKLVSITLASSLLKPILGVLLILYSDDKVNARILSIVLVELVCFSGCFFSQVFRGKRLFSFGYWKYVIAFSVPLLPHYLSMTLLNCADRIMIGNMCGEAEAGIYSLAYSISLIMTMFNNALFQTIEPWLYKKIKDGKIEDISRIAYLSFGCIAMANIILMLFAPEIIKIFAPSSYYDAIWVIPPVAMSVFFMFAYTFFATFEFFFEKKAYLVFATVVGAVLNIFLNYIFIRHFGYVAAGYTTLFCYFVYAVLHYVFMRNVCKLYFDNRQPYQLRVLCLILFVFLTSGFVTLLTYRCNPIRYSFIVIIGVLICVNSKKVKRFLTDIIHIKNGG